MSRTLVIQLARLGDLVQTMPMIASLRKQQSQDTIDLLCSDSIRDVGTLIPGINRTIGWNGPRWHRWAEQATPGLQQEQLHEIETELTSLFPYTYDRAFILNQHTRALVAGTLLAKECIGPLAQGPLSKELTPWASYIRDIARTRRTNRIHLSDAFCGMCGLPPPGMPPRCLTPLTSYHEFLRRSGREEGHGSGSLSAPVILPAWSLSASGAHGSHGFSVSSPEDVSC